MFRAMGSPTPRKMLHLPDLFPVRLVLNSQPSEAYFMPRGEVAVFLDRKIGRDHYMFRRSRTEQGRQVFVLYLRSLHDAQTVLLGLPQLQLVREQMPSKTR